MNTPTGTREKSSCCNLREYFYATGMTEGQKELIIKGISDSNASENIGKLVDAFGKESVADLKEIMTRALEIAFERLARQKVGDDILRGDL